MMEGIGSLKASHLALQEGGAKSSQKARQGTGQSDTGKKEVSAQRGQVEAPGAREVKALAEEMNGAIQQIEGNFSVSVDDATGMVVVRITDTSGELVKQVPPQQILDANVSVEKIIGLLIDDQA